MTATSTCLPSIASKEEWAKKRIESLLVLDTRLSQVDRDFLLRFFEKLGLAKVADLQDVGVLQPLPDYLRRELETYQQR